MFDIYHMRMGRCYHADRCELTAVDGVAQILANVTPHNYSTCIQLVSCIHVDNLLLCHRFGV